MITNQIFIDAARTYDGDIHLFDHEMSAEIYLTINGSGLVEETLNWELIESDDLMTWNRVNVLFYEALNGTQRIKFTEHNKKFLAFRTIDINEETGGTFGVIVESK